MFNKLNQILEKHLMEVVMNMTESNGYDKCHDFHHTNQTIQNSLDIMEELYHQQKVIVDVDMIVTIAAFHDIGLPQGRENHHIASAEILGKDTVVQQLFSESNIKIMMEAVEDHRASAKNPPRTVYGCIISDADRIIDPVTVISRSMVYCQNIHPDWIFEQCADQVFNHLTEKYGINGYAKMWLKTERNVRDLAKLRKLLGSITSFIVECKKYYKDIFESYYLIDQQCYEHDEEIYGCGCWSVCIDHDCPCGIGTLMRQGFRR